MLVTLKKNRGSLFDALYGTDAVSEDGGASRSSEYNPVCSLYFFLRFSIFFSKFAAPPSGYIHVRSLVYLLNYFFLGGGFLQDRGAASCVERSKRIQLAKPIVGKH